MQRGRGVDGGVDLSKRARSCAAKLATSAAFALWCAAAVGTRAAAEVTEERLGPAHVPVLAATLTPDGLHYAYVTQGGANGRLTESVIRDGVPDPEFDAVSSRGPLWSPDGQHVAYIARDRVRWLVVRDGEPGPLYDAVQDPSLVWSAHSDRLGYVGLRGGGLRVVTDAVESAVLRNVAAGSPVFSSDGLHMAYCAEDTVGWALWSGRLDL